MSGVVLSASVRQNLLSLQSTADLLATTQNRLSSGKKVNTALDNPTNFFTAAGLDSRASDINNLLDGIGNGVQILQAANTGISSLQKLIDSAKSIANQALQTTVGYVKSTATAATGLTGATATNLSGTSAAATAGTVTAGAFTALNVSGTGSAATAGKVDGTTYSAIDFSGSNTLGFSISVDGGAATAVSLTSADFTGAADDTAVTGQELADAINLKIGGGSTVASFAAGKLSFTSGTTGTGSSIAISGVTGAAAGIANTTAPATGTAGTSADSLAFSVTVDGTAKNITLSAANVATYNTAHSGATVDAANLGADDVAKLINYQIDSTGATNVASAVGGKLAFTSTTTGATSSIATSAVTGTATAGSTGIAVATNTGSAAVAGLSGTTLKIAATTDGEAVDITFGTASGQINTLDDLNAALAKNNMQASIDTAGKLTFTTTNDKASADIGAITGTAVATGGPLEGLVTKAAVKDPNSQATRASLIAQYNQVIDQIETTAKDSSFNGVNLLNGDTLKLTFNETGSSKLSISGVSFGPGGLGLSKLTAGSDFTDNAAANKTLASLNTASTTLRSQASSFGSNLSVVQIRQDFSKNLINVLQTGASNLTLADTNEEAANSQALSTRQSIAVSSLSLANTAQQGVLQLLR